MAIFYARYNGGLFGGGGGGGGSTPTYAQESLTGTFAAGNTTYTLSHTPSDANGLVGVLGAVPQAITVDYTLSGATVTFTGVDTSASNFLAIYPY